jgi:hypothetical protein
MVRRHGLGLLDGLARRHQVLRARRAALVEHGVDVRQLGQGLDEAGIQLHRAFEHLLGQPEPRHVVAGPGPQLHPAQVRLVGLHVLGGTGLQGLALGFEQGDVQLAGHLGGDVALHREDLLELAVVAVGPQMRVVGHADQLRRDAHPAGAVGRRSQRTVPSST